jgi:hypothetical protein
MRQVYQTAGFRENPWGAADSMRLIFLWGMPGSGKLTVAREVSAMTGWKVFHNHLTVDLLMEVFPFGSKEFIELRESIWLAVIEAAAASDAPGLIFTFNPENTVRQSFVERIEQIIRRLDGQLDYVEICCDTTAIEQRLDTPQRRNYKKLLSVQTFRQLAQQGVFRSPVMPPPKMRVDTTQQSPKEAAVQIVEGLGLPCSDERTA